MNFIITGINGSGKTTQANFLASKLNLKQISSDFVLKHHIDIKSELGIKYQLESETGLMGGNDILFDMIKYEIANLGRCEGYVLEGFPINYIQSIWVREHLQIDEIIKINVPESVAVTRMLARGNIDDTIPEINARIYKYNTVTDPIVDNMGISIVIDGENTIDVVADNIMRSLNQEPVKSIFSPSTWDFTGTVVNIMKTMGNIPEMSLFVAMIGIFTLS